MSRNWQIPIIVFTCILLSVTYALNDDWVRAPEILGNLCHAWCCHLLCYRGMINCAICKVGNAKCLCMINVTLCLSYLRHAMHCLLHFHVFIHLHIASHLGMLDAPCEGWDVGAKPKDSVWWIYPKDGRTKQVLGPEMSPGRCNLTELTCVGSQASPGAY